MGLLDLIYPETYTSLFSDTLTSLSGESLNKCSGAVHLIGKRPCWMKNTRKTIIYLKMKVWENLYYAHLYFKLKLKWKPTADSTSPRERPENCYQHLLEGKKGSDTNFCIVELDFTKVKGPYFVRLYNRGLEETKRRVQRLRNPIPLCCLFRWLKFYGSYEPSGTGNEIREIIVKQNFRIIFIFVPKLPFWLTGRDQSPSS